MTARPHYLSVSSAGHRAPRRTANVGTLSRRHRLIARDKAVAAHQKTRSAAGLVALGGDLG